MASFVGKDVSIKLKRDLGIFQGNKSIKREKSLGYNL